MQRTMISHDQAQKIARPGKSPPVPQQHQVRRHHHHGHPHTHAHHTHKYRKVMPPPPTPRRHPVEVLRPSMMLPPPVFAINSVHPVSPPLMPPNLNNLSAQRPVPMTPTSAPQRFIPPPSVSRLNTVANRQSVVQGHRIPFVPNGA